MTTKKKKKKLLNRPQALDQNFLTFKVGYGEEDSLFLSSLGEGSNAKTGQTYKLKGGYHTKAVISKFFGSLDGLTVNEKFLNLENHKISSLVPELILYKVIERDGKISSLKPFYFPVAADYQFSNNKVNLSKPFSGNNATIDSFQLTFTSQEVYDSARRFVEANLSITVDHMATLFEKEGSTDYAPLADLFTISAGNRISSSRLPKGKSKSKTLTRNALRNQASARIAATLGYNVPNNGIFDQTEIQLIQSLKAFVNLNYHGHTINFEQNGSVKVNVKYTGFLTSVKNESMYSLLSGTAGAISKARLKAPADQLGEDINKVFGEKSKEKKKDNEEVSEEEEDNLIIEDIQFQFKRVIDRLYEKEKVYAIDFEAFPFFHASGHLAKQRIKAAKNSGGNYKDNFENYQIGSATVEEEDIFSIFFDETIHYVNFGDFIEAYISSIHEILSETITQIDFLTEKDDDGPELPTDENLNKLKPKRGKAMKNYIRELKNKLFDAKILLADFETETIEVGGMSPKSVLRNISDVPVSLDTIYTYVFRNLSLARKFFFDINEFLTKMCLTILNQSLVEKPSCEMLKDISFMVSKVTSRDFKKRVKNGNLKIEDIPAPVGNYSKSSGKQMVEYIVFHQSPQVGVVPGAGKLSEDVKNGIFHLRLGQTHGLLKSINFSRQDDPGREAYLVIKNGRGYDELRLPHQASAEMVGNNLFLPMSSVYINPDTVGFGDPRMAESSSRRLGLGGYYIVGNVTTNYAAGNLTTSLQLHFNGFPDMDGSTNFEEVQKQSIEKLNTSFKNRNNNSDSAEAEKGEE